MRKLRGKVKLNIVSLDCQRLPVLGLLYIIGLGVGYNYVAWVIEAVFSAFVSFLTRPILTVFLSTRGSFILCTIIANIVY